jgi:hypothetical protein
MRRICRESVVVLASAALAFAPGLAAAQSQTGSGQVNEAKQTDPGSVESPKNAGKAGAGAVGDRLHDSAKNFGEALFDGIKYAGRSVIGFFNGDKPKP